MKTTPTYRAVLVSLAVALFLSGCAQENPETLVRSAKTYLANNDRKAALIQLKTALQQQPNLPEARFLLGNTLLETGDPVGAEVELRKAMTLKYPRADVAAPLAQAMVSQGKSKEVIQDFDGIRLSDPIAAAGVKLIVATAYTQQGDRNKATEKLQESLQLAPEFSPALLAMARQHAGARQFDDASQLVDKVLAKEPANYDALQLKGDLSFYTRGDAAAALALHQRALAQRADWLPAHSSILEILLTKGDLTAARAQLEKMRATWPTHPLTAYFAAQLAFLKGDYNTARELTARLQQVAPENLGVLLLGGALELQTGSLLQAEAYAAKALKAAPELAAPRRLLTRVYMKGAQYAKASDTLAPLLQGSAADTESFLLAAEAALRSGDAARAEAFFAQASKRDPEDASSRTALAVRQFTKGRAEIAYTQLQEIAGSDKSTVADLAIISTRMHQKDYPGALQAIDALEKKEPGKATAFQLRGQVHLATNDVTAARQSFEKALASEPKYFPAASSLAALAMQEKKPKDARQYLQKVLTADPKNLQARLAIAEVRAQSGGTKDEVAQLLAEAIKLHPTDAAPRLILTEVYLQSKDARAALATAQDASTAMPNNPALHDALGRAQLATGDALQAINSFRRVVALQPRSAQAYLRLADAFVVVKDFDASRESLRRALELAPGSVPVQRALVQVELAAKRPDQAMAIARGLQRERPAETHGYVMEGDVEASRRNWEAAAAAYRGGIARSPSTELAVKLHYVLTSAQKRDEAERFVAAWAKDHPGDVKFRAYLGDLALNRSDFASAESHYLAVVKAQPDNPVVLNNLAFVAHKLKKPEAVAYAEKANTLSPGRPVYMDTLATVLSESGDVARAIELENRALELAPEFHAGRLNLARFYLKAGDKKRAQAELDTLAKLGDRFKDQPEVRELQKL